VRSVIVDYYRNDRIDVNTVQADRRWKAEVRTLLLFSHRQIARRDRECYKLAAKLPSTAR